MGRPEHIGPPELFYSEDEAKKYTKNSRIIKIQQELTERSLELLSLENKSSLILDIGAGSGISSRVVEKAGHSWIGIDISENMLSIANQRDDLENKHLVRVDIGHGIPFRPGIFDGVVSISVLQWLCNADTSFNEPRHRLKRFFQTLYSSMAYGKKAVFQFYPENSQQIDMILKSALQSGFNGGMVIDYPHSSKKKKYFLCLVAGPATTWKPPRDDTVQKKPPKGSYAWIKRKKEILKSRGVSVPKTTKYTGRKRGPKF